MSTKNKWKCQNTLPNSLGSLCFSHMNGDFHETHQNIQLHQDGIGSSYCVGASLIPITTNSVSKLSIAKRKDC